MLTEDEKNLILKWYDSNGRDFPWRETCLSPYKALFTEFLLQRTKANSVKHMWIDFFEKYPDLEVLNYASKEELCEELKPLGLYNRRARDIDKTTTILVEDFDSNIPNTQKELLNLPGVGHYIANSTLCFGFDQKMPIIDTNVKRVYEYITELDFKSDLRRDVRLQRITRKNLPKERYKEFNWALLDLGHQLTMRTPEVLKRISEDN